MKKNIRQGDVFLQRIEKIPDGLKLKDNIVAYGETTGHKHRIEQASVLVSADGIQYVEAKQTASLIHDEHAQKTVPKGKYRVILQREVDLLGEVRQVMD